jgi:Mg2+/Co2+ transporter CorB
MHLNVLWISLISLIVISSFFSIAETAYMSVNRYRIRHLAKHGNISAKRVNQLLERPDRLLGVILLGDTFADIFASAIATLIAVHYLGEVGVIVATIILTLVVLIAGELAPKTLAALYPTPIVLRASLPLWLLLKILYPIVWMVNILSNGLLRLFGVRASHTALEHFNTEELRTVVTEASRHIPSNYQRMLLQLLDLEKTHVADIMIPRNEIVGIDICKPWSDILTQLTTSQHMRLPVFEEHIDNIKGVLHLRDAVNLLAQENLSKATLTEILEDPYFIPEGSVLSKQLLQFCHQKVRTGLVVNEYGEILGLVALEDILEEIVGEFTTDTAAATHKEILQEIDGSYLVDGGINLRSLNRRLQTAFPLTGPKTLNGLITEYLETIPPANICITLAGYRLEILQVKENMVKTVRIIPQ